MRLHRLLPLAAVSVSALAACDQFEDPDIAQIGSIDPDSGAVGSLVMIEAENLLNNTRVVFFDEVESPIAALFVDDRVATIVPEGAETGDVVLETGGERSSSRAPFTVIPPPPSTPAFFEDATGPAVAAFEGGCRSEPEDDGFARFTLPFQFPFYGRPQTEMFVTTNGQITFGSPRPCDNSGRTGDFNTADKISALTLDLEPGIGGAVRVNATDPNQVVVTWSEVPLCGLEETSNTFQAVLFPDGRIRMNFGYLSTRGVGTQCLADDVSNSLVGITPLTVQRLVQVSYFVQPTVTIGPQEGVFNQYFVDRFFDLENRSLLFTPLAEGGIFSGYRVELLPAE